VGAVTAESYEAFDRARPYRRLTVGGLPVDYLASGSGERTLLLLPGLLGDAKSLYRQILDFERDRRVIALSYVDTLAIRPQLDAISAALDAEGAGRVAAVGQTLGGYVAQAYARERPERVEALVLAHSGLPDPRLGAEVRRDARLARLAPYFLIRWYLERALLKMVSRLERKGEIDASRAAEIRARFRHRFARLLTKERVLARYGLIANLHQEGPLRPADFAGLAGRVLILHAGGTVFGRRLDALKEMYPGARVQSMGEGHNISLLIKPEESNRAIRELLKGGG